MFPTDAESPNALAGLGDLSVLQNLAAPLGLQGSAVDPNDINEYINPPTDPRLNSILKKTGSTLRQGILQQTDDAVGGLQRYPYGLRFMFNPPTIGVTYGVDPDAIPATQLTAGQLKGTSIYPGSTGISWDLLFDRTYEVQYGPTQTNRNDLRQIGVYADIAALERVVGCTAGVLSDAANPNSELQIGAMRTVPVYVVFGGGKNNAGLAFVGTITNMTVTYSLFSQNMVPTRAAVSLSMQQIIGREVFGFKERGGTLIDRAHAPGRLSTSSGQNIANPGSTNPGFSGR